MATSDALIGAGASIAGNLLGINLDKNRQQTQFNQQSQLMDKQQNNQMALNKQMQDIQMQNWEKTNYAAQVGQMEKAGLNVGMMYGGGGAGGQTMSSGSGGSAASGSAPNFGNSGAGLGAAGAQLGMITSQIAVNEAQARNLNADADTKEGKNPTGAANITQTGANTALTNMNTKNAEIQNQIGTKSLENVLDTIKANRDTAVAESTKSIVGANVGASTQNAQIEKIKNEAIQSAVQIAVQKEGIKLNEAQIKNMIEQVKIGKFNAEKISTDQVQGEQLNLLISKLYKMFGVDNKQIK